MLVNPVSGRGRGERYALELAPALVAAGLELEVCHLNPPPVEYELDEFVASCDGLVVVGGDGTLQSVLHAAVEGKTPVYHAPLGTENLFAREVGMTTMIEQVVSTIDRREVKWFDIGRSSTDSFLMMLSVGFDAHVIHRLARRRKGAITHLNYVRPILAELVRGHTPRLTVVVDGEEVVRDQTGLVVIANSRQYGMRLDPAPHASMMDGLLDMVFFPLSHPASLVPWGVRARMGRHLRHRRLITGQGREISVRSSNGPILHQMDGEAGGLHEERASELEARVEPNVLPVFIPG